MACNATGFNKYDPWKNRGGKEQGPPDLDDVFKNLFGKFGKSGGNGGGSGKSLGGIGAGILVGLLVVIWFISGFYTIREAERGVVFASVVSRAG